MDGDMSRAKIQDKLNLANRVNFIKTYLNPAIEMDFIELTIPDKPKSRNQKYRLTLKGLEYKAK